MTTLYFLLGFVGGAFVVSSFGNLVMIGVLKDTNAALKSIRELMESNLEMKKTAIDAKDRGAFLAISRN